MDSKTRLIKRVVREHYKYITEYLDPQHLLGHLYEREIISHRQLLDLRKTDFYMGRISQAYTLLDILMESRHPRTMPELMNSLLSTSDGINRKIGQHLHKEIERMIEQNMHIAGTQVYKTGSSGSSVHISLLAEPVEDEFSWAESET